MPLSVTDTAKPIKVIVDTDAGVDDSAAIAWLLSQKQHPIDLLGITTVAGNTSVENVARNVLTILDKVGRQDIPVLLGAAQPLQQPLSISGAFVHGPDGLWLASGTTPPPDVTALATDVAAFYKQHAAPDVILLALGPLTNLALALAVCPDEIAKFKQIIFLGGAINGGNRTPVAEYNVWYDPEAAATVLSAGLPITMVPLETFRTFTLSDGDIDQLATEGTAVSQFLAAPLRQYGAGQNKSNDASETAVADVVAAIYMMDQSIGQTQPALVEIVAGIDETGPHRLLRGQTIIGLEFAERITMIADDLEIRRLAEQGFSDPDFNLQAALGAILGRKPDNSNVVTEIDTAVMHQRFMQAFLPE